MSEFSEAIRCEILFVFPAIVGIIALISFAIAFYRGENTLIWVGIPLVIGRVAYGLLLVGGKNGG